jgi:hypothetical protein
MALAPRHLCGESDVFALLMCGGQDQRIALIRVPF